MNDLIIHCIKCDQRQRPCSGQCACLVTKVDITVHAKLGFCPHPSGPEFGDGIKPDGWCAAAWPVAKIPADYTPDQYKAGGCGCDGSQTSDG